MQPPAIYTVGPGQAPPPDAPEGSLAVNWSTGERAEKRGGVWLPPDRSLIELLETMLARLDRIAELLEKDEEE